MAKKNYKNIEDQKSMLVEEPMFVYVGNLDKAFKSATKKQKTQIANFSFSQFKKLQQKIDIPLADWANLLYTSERTLLRYAKANLDFDGLQAERLALFSTLIDKGYVLFGNNLAMWLKTSAMYFQGASPFEQLYTYEGIKSVLDYLGQLEHGITA